MHRIYGTRQQIDFDGSLPLGKSYNVGMYNWGFVDGKTQTRAVGQMENPYTYEEPTIWFHEIFCADGTSYRQAEVDLMQRLTSEPKAVEPTAAR